MKKYQQKAAKLAASIFEELKLRDQRKYDLCTYRGLCVKDSISSSIQREIEQLIAEAAKDERS